MTLKSCDFYQYNNANLMQQKYAIFRPWMAHSINEGSRIVIFHAHLLSDFAKIEELSEKFIDELGR